MGKKRRMQDDSIFLLVGWVSWRCQLRKGRHLLERPESLGEGQESVRHVKHPSGEIKMQLYI